MCDTLVVLLPDRVLFAKSSDRDANEAQVPTWTAAARHGPHDLARCTRMAVPQVRETLATLVSRPFWMWGAEIGANEAGVVIGNEAVFTRAPVAATGLLGMDLLRLALERAPTAKAAVEVIVDLLEAHGQGGGCGLEDPSFTYHNSFLVADATGAWVVETAGRHWETLALERPAEGARAYSISNALSIPAFAARHSERLGVKTWGSGAAGRASRTCALASQARSLGDLRGILRDHGPESATPRYRWLNGGLHAPCMHGGGLIASSQTTASWVSELGPGGARHQITATSGPCTSLFKPARVDAPLDLGAPREVADGSSLWWRHERLHRAVLRDPAPLLAQYAAERDALEARWDEAPPEPASAFAEADRWLERWTARVEAASAERPDTRPWWARRYWSRREEMAGRAPLRR